jgi:hypothetical protein
VLDEARRFSAMGPLGLAENIDAIAPGLVDGTIYRECSPSDREMIEDFGEIERLRAALAVRSYLDNLRLRFRLAPLLDTLGRLGDHTTFVPVRSAVDVEAICEAKRRSSRLWPEHHVHLLSLRRVRASRTLARETWVGASI